MKNLIPYLFLLLASPTFAQTIIKGTYDSKKRIFTTESSNQRRVEFSDGLGAYFNGNLWGFIDTTGKVICEPRYDEVEGFMDGIARVTNRVDYEDVYGFIDKTGKEIVPVKYDEADDCHGHRCADVIASLVEAVGRVGDHERNDGSEKIGRGSQN